MKKPQHLIQSKNTEYIPLSHVIWLVIAKMDSKKKSSKPIRYHHK